MARTNAWSDTQPADANPANTLGQSDRTLRVDVREAFQQLIGNTLGDALQDPIVPSGRTINELYAAIGAIDGILLEFGVSKSISVLSGAFQGQDGSGNPYVPLVTVPASVVGGGTPSVLNLSFGFNLPVGSILTGVDFCTHSDGNTNSSFTYSIYKKTLNAVSTSNTTVASATKSNTWVANNMYTLSHSALGESVTAGVGYGLNVILTPANTDRLYFHGALITYTTPTLG